MLKCVLTSLIATFSIGFALALNPVQAADHALAQVQNQSRGEQCTPGAQAIAGQEIARISIQQGPIFDPPFQGVLAPLYKGANRLHITTRQSVLRDDLLFTKGDVFDPQITAATERRLRARQYLNGVQIITEQVCDSDEDLANVNVKVHVKVKVKEVWTLEPQFRFSQTGDESTYNIGIQETNLFGMGKTIAASRYSDAYRQGSRLYYVDPNIGLYESELRVGYADNDDGGSHSVSLIKPFVSLDTPWSAGFQFLDSEQDDRVYNAGSEIDHYKVYHQDSRIFYGFPLNQHVYDHDQSKVTRLIFGYSHIDKDYSAVEQTISVDRIPDKFSFQYPWVEMQYIHHLFQQRTNIAAMNRIEDINFGPVLTGRLGYVISPQDRLDQQLFFSLTLGQYFELSQTQLLRASGQFKSFIDPGSVGDMIDTFMSVDLHYHWNPQVFDNKGQLFLRFHESRVIDPLNNGYLEIGANAGARGYPSRYQAGDRRQTLTVEQRYFGDREWFSLVYIGGALFYDASHTWGEAVVSPTEQGWLHSAGIGLRISSNRLSGREGGGHSTLHVDFAGPVGASRAVDATQLLITVKRSF